jgi:hypothetical protein
MPHWMHRTQRAPGALAWRWFTGQPLDGVPRTDAGWFTEGHAAPGALAWRWFTGQPLDGVPRTDAGWFTEGHAELNPETAPRPPEALGAEVRADLRGLRAEWREMRVRRRLGREWRETERRVLSEHQGDAGTP